MENIIAWFFRVTRIRLVIIMCVIYLIFPLYLLPNIINTGSVGPLDLLFWYDHATLYQMLSSYGEAVRSRYTIGLLTADVAYPIYYGTLLALIFALVFTKLAIPFSKKIILVPYVAVLFDLTENSLLVFLLSSFPTKHIDIANLAGYITAIKWSAFGVIATTIIYLVLYGIQSRKRKSHIR
ncbi:MAG: hypothetical protein ABJK37_19610 [Paraglaciecola sp.]|uniref:hypothetical protein n=1 Tax=Paraglaciecola sp. TaxID=1920173 RepID=UPI00329A13A4